MSSAMETIGLSVLGARCVHGSLPDSAVGAGDTLEVWRSIPDTTPQGVCRTHLRRGLGPPVDDLIKTKDGIPPSCESSTSHVAPEVALGSPLLQAEQGEHGGPCAGGSRGPGWQPRTHSYHPRTSARTQAHDGL